VIFRREGDLFVPSAHARGPWDPDAQHGGAPAALIADAVARLDGGEGFFVARLSYEFLGPVPLAPLRLEARLTRPGRRLQFAEAEIEADGTPVLRARAVRLRRADVALPAEAVDGAAPPVGLPATAPAPFPSNWGEAEGFHRTGMEIRSVAPPRGARPSLAWFRLAGPLVEGEEPEPVARAVAAADFGNGVSRIVDFERYLFVNTDLTVHLHREPVGEWVLLESRTRLERHGAGLATSTLYDEQGALGLAAQSLFVDAR